MPELIDLPAGWDRTISEFLSGMVSADALDLVLYEINLVETARRVG